MSDQILVINGLCLDYNIKGVNQTVLNGIDLVQKKNEWLALIGPNGAGKTSLALIIKGLLNPTGGILRMFSECMLEDLRERKARVGFLFSNPRDQICSTIVQDDIAFGLVYKGLPKKEIKHRVTEAMETLGISHLAYHLTHRICGGEQQKVALAGLIAMRPEYIILDEPASFLSSQERDELLNIVKKFHQGGMSILYIASSWEEVSKADKVAVLNKGKISCIASPLDLLHDENAFESARICLPDIYLLAKRLRQKGVCLPENIQDVDQMTHALIKHFKGEA